MAPPRRGRRRQQQPQAAKPRDTDAGGCEGGDAESSFGGAEASPGAGGEEEPTDAALLAAEIAEVEHRLRRLAEQAVLLNGDERKYLLACVREQFRNFDAKLSGAGCVGAPAAGIEAAASTVDGSSASTALPEASGWHDAGGCCEPTTVAGIGGAVVGAGHAGDSSAAASTSEIHCNAGGVATSVADGGSGSWVLSEPPNGDNVAEKVALAKAILAEGDIATARSLLENVVQTSPGSFAGWYNLAFLCDVAHDHEAFAQYIDRALGVDDTHAIAWLYRGMCCERIGDLEGAEEAYKSAVGLDRNGKVGADAQSQLRMLDRNRGCPLLARNCWADASTGIVGQLPRPSPVNLPSEVLVPHRPVFAAEACSVWDHSLAPDLLEALAMSIEDLSTFLRRNPRNCRTFWLDRDDEPRLAMELAGRLLLERVLGLKSSDFAGIEWWCKNQTANLGAHFHYDMPLQQEDGLLWRPTYSSVLYLSSAGGPTVVLDQAADKSHPQWPPVPQEGFVVSPRLNRWLVFPGELRHGMVTLDDEDTRPRYVVLFNYWTTHRPAAPACQPPAIDHYRPFCATAPANSRHLLSDQEIDKLMGIEAARQPGVEGDYPQLVPLEEMKTPEDLPWSSTFGELSLAMPMPSLSRLRSGCALFMPWRKLAEQMKGKQPGSAYIPHLAQRIKDFERPVNVPAGIVQRRQVSAGICTLLPHIHEDAAVTDASVKHWLASAFVAKAKELARKELAKAMKNGDDCLSLALTSLATFVAEHMKVAPSKSELRGAAACASASAKMATGGRRGIGFNALELALFHVLQEDFSKVCSPTALFFFSMDLKHGVVMTCKSFLVGPKSGSKASASQS